MTVAGALRELREAPWPLLVEVMERRSYARAKATWDGAKDPYALPSSPALTLVKSVREEITRRRLREQGRHQ